MTDQKEAKTTYGKQALVKDVASHVPGLSQQQVGAVLDAALKAIQEQVASGQSVTLTGFGTFRRSTRAERQGTNIRTRQTITIPAANVARFTPGSEFKAAVSDRGSNR